MKLKTKMRKGQDVVAGDVYHFPFNKFHQENVPEK